MNHDVRARAIPVVIAAAFGMLLASCEKKPGGQVVAVVGGQELTQQDVRAQAMSENINSKEALDAATPMLVGQIVDRTVLADYARDNKLDRAPEYVARRRQMDESLLAYLGLRKLVGTMQSPTPAQVSAYIAANPLAFAQRQVLTLDQLRFKTPADEKSVSRLAQLDNLELIIAKLNSDGVKFSRVQTTFDTGSVDPGLAKQIARLGDGEIFDLSTNGTSYISKIKGRTPSVHDQSKWQAEAMEQMRTKMLNASIRTKLNALKKATKVQYDPAYQPKNG